MHEPSNIFRSGDERARSYTSVHPSCFTVTYPLSLCVPPVSSFDFKGARRSRLPSLCTYSFIKLFSELRYPFLLRTALVTLRSSRRRKEICIPVLHLLTVLLSFRPFAVASPSLDHSAGSRTSTTPGSPVGHTKYDGTYADESFDNLRASK